jgi:hypothetical protein
MQPPAFPVKQHTLDLMVFSLHNSNPRTSAACYVIQQFRGKHFVPSRSVSPVGMLQHLLRQGLRLTTASLVFEKCFRSEVTAWAKSPSFVKNQQTSVVSLSSLPNRKHPRFLYSFGKSSTTVFCFSSSVADSTPLGLFNIM